MKEKERRTLLGRRFVLTAMSAALGLGLVGCGSGGDSAGSADSEKKGRIGMTCMDLTNPFFKLIANVMTEEAAKHGYEVVALSGELDPAKQNSQLADFVAQGYDAIFLNPVDSKAAGQGVKTAHASGIPVFTFDIQVSDDEAKDLVVSHLGSDNFQGGVLAGESMIEALGNKGKIAVVSLPEVSSCILRVEGFQKALKDAGSPIEIVTELSGKAGMVGMPSRPISCRPILISAVFLPSMIHPHWGLMQRW